MQVRLGKINLLLEGVLLPRVTVRRRYSYPGIFFEPALITPFHIHSPLLAFFLSVFIFFHSCYSHATVLENTRASATHILWYISLHFQYFFHFGILLFLVREIFSIETIGIPYCKLIKRLTRKRGLSLGYASLGHAFLNLT